MNNTEECIICFENLNDYSVAILSCGHKFHLHCIQGWKNTQGKSSNFTRLCSYCRDSTVEIINIIDGKKRDPKPVKQRKSSEPSNSSGEPPRAHIYERRRISISGLEFVGNSSNTNEDLWCCCNIL